MKDTWKDYFSFNKQQRNGILVLVSLITLLIVYLFIADYFPSSAKPADFSSFKTELEKAGVKSLSSVEKNKSSTPQVDINSADTSLLMTLPKMSSYCARMIVGYRKKLGGYCTTRQLKEVWGMDSSMFNAVINKVWADSGSVHKINVNTADIKQLGYHPYIKYYLAKAIVNYREEHGLFSSLNDLHKMAAIDDTTFTKIEPYLTVENK
jgi:competence protein ComEA